MPFDPTPKDLVDQAISEQEVPKKYRMMYRKALQGKSRRAAMNVFCLYCQGWENGARLAVRDCAAFSCPLWAYRPYQDETSKVD